MMPYSVYTIPPNGLTVVRDRRSGLQGTFTTVGRRYQHGDLRLTRREFIAIQREFERAAHPAHRLSRLVSVAGNLLESAVSPDCYQTSLRRWSSLSSKYIKACAGL